jgi:hypothetical protein
MRTCCLRLTALLAPPQAAAAACLACCCALPAPGWSLARALLRESRRAEALERRDERARRINAEKAAVTAEALAGRLTLAEAACLFEEAEGEMDDGDGLVCPYRAAAGEPGLSLNVLVWAASRVGEDRGAAAALARLKGEYRQRFGKLPRKVRRDLWQLCRVSRGPGTLPPGPGARAGGRG